MKKQTTNLFAVIIIALIASSCASVYIPTKTNVPLFEKKGETQLTAAVSTNSVHASVDYAITDKIAVMVNGSTSFYNFSNRFDIYHSESDNVNSSSSFSLNSPNNYRFAHNYGEFAVGRYNIPVGIFIMETYAGVGTGNSINETYKETFGETIKGQYYLAFLQANIGKRMNLRKIDFDFGGALRLGTSFYEYNNSYDIYNINMFHIEPMVFFRAGTEKLKVIARIGGAFKIQGQSPNDLNSPGFEDGNLLTTRSHISLGVNYKFNLQ